MDRQLSYLAIFFAACMFSLTLYFESVMDNTWEENSYLRNRVSELENECSSNYTNVISYKVTVTTYNPTREQCDDTPNITSDGTKIKDLHLITTSAFQNPLYTFFYVFCMGALFLHLKHGVESAIQTVGLKIPSYEKAFKYGAILIAFSIPAVFASIPIYLYISSL